MRYTVHSRSFAAPAISRPGALRFGGPVLPSPLRYVGERLVCCDSVGTSDRDLLRRDSLRFDLFDFKTRKRFDNLIGIEKIRPRHRF